MFEIHGNVIRLCLTCGVIYVEKIGNLTYIKPCKKCESGTGFFETREHFYRYVDLYGIETDLILNKDLKIEVEEKYG